MILMNNNNLDIEHFSFQSRSSRTNIFAWTRVQFPMTYYYHYQLYISNSFEIETDRGSLKNVLLGNNIQFKNSFEYDVLEISTRVKLYNNSSLKTNNFPFIFEERIPKFWHSIVRNGGPITSLLSSEIVNSQNEFYYLFVIDHQQPIDDKCELFWFILSVHSWNYW